MMLTTKSRSLMTAARKEAAVQRWEVARERMPITDSKSVSDKTSSLSSTLTLVEKAEVFKCAQDNFDRSFGIYKASEQTLAIAKKIESRSFELYQEAHKVWVMGGKSTQYHQFISCNADYNVCLSKVQTTEEWYRAAREDYLKLRGLKDFAVLDLDKELKKPGFIDTLRACGKGLNEKFDRAKTFCFKRSAEKEERARFVTWPGGSGNEAPTLESQDSVGPMMGKGPEQGESASPPMMTVVPRPDEITAFGDIPDFDDIPASLQVDHRFKWKGEEIPAL